MPTKEQRNHVFESQNWRCCYCGFRMYAVAREDTRRYWNQIKTRFVRTSPYGRKRILRFARATIEHIVRRADGGSKHAPNNLVGACNWCNSARNDIAAEEWFEEVKWLKMEGKHPLFPHLEQGSASASGPKP